MQPNEQGDGVIAPPAEQAESAPATVDQANVTDATDATPAPSAEDAKEGLLDAVQKVVTPSEELPADGSDILTDDGETVEAQSTGDKEGTEADKDDGGDAEDLTKEPSPDELKAFPKRTQKRIRQLLDKTKTLSTENDQLRQQVDQVKPYQDFIAQSGLTNDDLSIGLQAMATLKKGDFENFLKAVGPYVRQAQEFTGQVLPDDLGKRVQQGHMTEQAASEMAQSRHQAALEQQRAQAAQAEAQQVQAQQFGESVKTAVNAREDQVKASDPDYARKLPLIEDRIVRLKADYLAQYQQPISPEVAVAIYEAAYEHATQTTKAMQPAPQPTQSNPSAMQRSATGGSASPEPKSLMEAAVQALRQPSG